MSDTARSLGVSRPTVYKLIEDGRLRCVNVGRRRIVPVAVIDQFLNES